MFDLWTFVLGLAVFIVIKLCLMGRRPKDMPPGPRTWPFIGNLGYIYNGERFHYKAYELGQQFNGMFSFQYCKYPGLIITDFALAKEAFIDKGDYYSDRPLHSDWNKALSSPDQKGVVESNGETWRKLRRLTLHSLKDLGLGKATIENNIQDEAAVLVKAIEAEGDKFFSFDNLFNKATTNVICAVLFNKRYSYDDTDFIKQIDNYKGIMRHFGLTNVFQYLPWWTFLFMPIMKPEVKKVIGCMNHVKQWIGAHIAEHKQHFDDTNLRDFVDVYLHAQATEKNAEFFSDKQLFTVIFELLGAASDTTGTTLLWTILYLTKYPEIQDKCREEIKKNLGEKHVSYADKTKLPYLEATINEVQRRCNTLPFPVPHNTTKETNLGGYVIPKDTMVSISMYAIHMDEKLWDDPWAFKPERFLDENGKMERPEHFMPFGYGRRTCLGEPLARMELFIILTELLQKYKFETENPDTLPTPEETDLGLTLLPDEYKVRATKVM